MESVASAFGRAVAAHREAPSHVEAALVALNLPGTEVGGLVDEYSLNRRPRPNRALLIDRHDNRRTLIVP